MKGATQTFFSLDIDLFYVKRDFRKATKDVEESPQSLASPKPRREGISGRKTSSDIPGT